MEISARGKEAIILENSASLILYKKTPFLSILSFTKIIFENISPKQFFITNNQAFLCLDLKTIPGWFQESGTLQGQTFTFEVFVMN